MSITITPRGKYEGLSRVAAGAGTMANMRVSLGWQLVQCEWKTWFVILWVTIEVENVLVLLFTSIHFKTGGIGLNLSLNKYPSNFKFQVVTHVFRTAGLVR